MLVGYGTTDSEYGSSSVGEDYWLVKNEWCAWLPLTHRSSFKQKL